MRTESRTELLDEAGMTTAELLGNAALGVAALVALWAGLEALGFEILDWIRESIR